MRIDWHDIPKVTELQSELQDIVSDMQKEFIEFKKKNPNHPKLEDASKRISYLIEFYSYFSELFSYHYVLITRYNDSQSLLHETMTQLNDAKKQIKAMQACDTEIKIYP